MLLVLEFSNTNGEFIDILAQCDTKESLTMLGFPHICDTI